MEQAIRDREPAGTNPPSPEIYRGLCIISIFTATAFLRGDNHFGFFSVVESRQLLSIQALTRQPALLDGESVLPSDYYSPTSIASHVALRPRDRRICIYSVSYHVSAKNNNTFVWNRVPGEMNTTLKNYITLYCCFILTMAEVYPTMCYSSIFWMLACDVWWNVFLVLKWQNWWSYAANLGPYIW